MDAKRERMSIPTVGWRPKRLARAKTTGRQRDFFSCVDSCLVELDLRKTSSRRRSVCAYGERQFLPRDGDLSLPVPPRKSFSAKLEILRLTQLLDGSPCDSRGGSCWGNCCGLGSRSALFGSRFMIGSCVSVLVACVHAAPQGGCVKDVGTKQIVLSLSNQYTDKQGWEAAEMAPRVAARRWLHHRLGVEVLDVRFPTRIVGREQMQVVAQSRVPARLTMVH